MRVFCVQDFVFELFRISSCVARPRLSIQMIPFLFFMQFISRILDSYAITSPNAVPRSVNVPGLKPTVMMMIMWRLQVAKDFLSSRLCESTLVVLFNQFLWTFFHRLPLTPVLSGSTWALLTFPSSVTNA